MRAIIIILFFINGAYLCFSQGKGISHLYSTIVSQNEKFGLVEDGTGKVVLLIEYDTVISHTLFKGVYSFSKTTNMVMPNSYTIGMNNPTVGKFLIVFMIQFII